MKRILIVDDAQGWRDYHLNIVKEILPDAEIQLACSASEGYDKLMENNSVPFDVIITDMQMETDFAPKYAGEWFVEQIKTFKNYLNTKIVIISAAPNARHIAEMFGVECIPKQVAYNFPQSYKEVL
jgi:CheY-like chemotaxis protein